MLFIGIKKQFALD